MKGMQTLKDEPYKLIWHIDPAHVPDARNAIITKYLQAKVKPDMIVMDGFVSGSTLIDELRDLNIPVEPYRFVKI